MTDLSTDIASETQPGSDDHIIRFALKNDAGEMVVDTTQVPIRQYREALRLGLKAMAERAMTKITKEAYPVEAERKAAIRAKAEQNLQEVYDDKAKIAGETKAKAKTSGAVMTEARRIARNLIKDQIKQNKGKITHYKPSQITELANQLIANDPSLLVTAEANLKARAEIPVKLNVMGLLKEDPERVAKDEADKAARKANKPLSAKQAGKTVPRALKSKPGVQAHA